MLDRRIFLKRTAILSAAAFTGLPALGNSDAGQVVLNIDPGKDNPRNSEGAFLTLNSGRILFFYTRFYGGARDESPAQIVSIHSDDSGRTWSPAHQVVVENHAVENVMSVSLLRLQGGSVAMFYLVKNSLLDCRPVLCISTDECQTWSAPRAITHAPGYFVLNNDRVIQLSGGRLVVPLALHRARGNEPKNYASWDRRAIAVWLLSDDEGKTWREADDWWALPERTRSGLQEPGVVELADGRLFSWMRTDQESQYGCWSTDNGKTWEKPGVTALASPESPASIKRLPDSPDLLAIYNDHSGRFPFVKGKRTPLVSAVSTDGAKTWSRHRIIESAPEGWYCYTAIHFVKDAALLAYCAGDRKVGGLNRLRIRRLDLNWFRT